jgi:hypothetical protein
MRWRNLLLALGILAVAFSACSSNNGSSSSALLASQTYGNGDGAFTMSFTQPPTTSLGYAGGRPDPSTTTNPSPLPALGSRVNWFGGDVIVAVIKDPESVAPGRIEAQLRSYLPVATGGRMILIDGMPAIREIIDCVLPSGPCPGKTAGLEILDGSTLFDVFTTGLDEGATLQALSSFRVSLVSTTPGCSFTVNRRGFTQRCKPSG